jgi:hypothetical protein
MGGLPVGAAGAEPKEGAATAPFLPALDGDTVAEGRCTPDQFRL